MSFQQTLNRDPARAVAGDFASTNPRSAMLAGEGALRTAEPITVGQFAFADLTTGEVHAANDTGRTVGFVHRNNQAVVPMGQSASMVIPKGREIALFTEGDFYCVLDDDSTVGADIYADANTGEATLDGTDNVATRYKAAEAKEAGELVKITVTAI